jgi:hypothetical protein
MASCVRPLFVAFWRAMHCFILHYPFTIAGTDAYDKKPRPPVLSRSAAKGCLPASYRCDLAALVNQCGAATFGRERRAAGDQMMRSR